ncbi:uncharacterized protein LW94_8170 [Fusarium fujikuroi]|nr:uncharacterized protein LW94_8170 [Fusarium fujikuroi]SCO34566.1 uncharacterized protein FFMR_03538 [Fusarium fujikuroi]
MLSSTPITVLDPNAVIPSLSTRVRSSLTMPTQILVARNSTENTTTNTTTKAKDSPIFNPDSEGIISLAILAGILAFFVGLVLRDLLDRRRTGEFKEDKRSCRRFFRTLFHLPCLMCSKDNWKQLWIKFANLFRSKANQRVVKKADQDGIELIQRLENGKTIGTFNGAWSPKPAFNRKSGSKGKAVDTAVLPQAADFSVIMAKTAKASNLLLYVVPAQGLSDTALLNMTMLWASTIPEICAPNRQGPARQITTTALVRVQLQPAVAIGGRRVMAMALATVTVIATPTVMIMGRILMISATLTLVALMDAMMAATNTGFKWVAFRWSVLVENRRLVDLLWVD